MSRYAKVDTRTWGDEKFRALSRPQPNAQSLFLYLLSGPHAQGPGLFEAGEYGLAEKLRWPIEGFRAAMAELIAAGMVQVDWEAHVVLVVNALKHDPPGNGNVLKHWYDLLDTVPECDLKRRYMQTLQPLAERFGVSTDDSRANPLENHSAKGFMNGLAKGSRNPLPNPEPKPEPEPFPEPKPQPEPTRARAQETPPAPLDEPAEAVEVVRSVNDLTTDRPVDLVAALCAELGTELMSVEPDWRKTQFGLARQILDAGHSAERVRQYVRYMRAETWRTNGIDLLDVKKGIGKWEANGAAALPTGRASPGSSRAVKISVVPDGGYIGGKGIKRDEHGNPINPRTGEAYIDPDLRAAGGGSGH